jgi:uncharacterized protein with von Willebrand factor type A (vWA) domain
MSGSSASHTPGGQAGPVATTLAGLARRAGRWLGLAQSPPPAQHTCAVDSDRFDTMAWRDTYEQAPALRELAEDLGQRHDYTQDLLADAFLGAYKASPQLREEQDMDPSRLVNHRVIDSMLTSPELDELRRETAGDPYAAAMAVLAQTDGLRTMLERARDAQRDAERARELAQQATDAAQAVEQALRDVAGQADEDGSLSADDAGAVRHAIDQAQAADQAAHAAQDAARRSLASATPGIRVAARSAAAHAAYAAAEEAALMRAWGVQPGKLERMSFTQRAQLAARLRGGRLGRFAELIGRFRRMASGERARRVEHAPGELAGITLGDDLSRVIPSELTNIGIPALRPVFASRYAEARLMVYDSRGEQNTGQGAIIACVDCSRSMAAQAGGGNTGEAWAKACALALLDQARQSTRDFTAILFSSTEQVTVFRFPATRTTDITDVIEFTEHFFDGGTDFQTPLSTAVRLLEAEYNTDGRERGDIVFITDGETRVSEDWMRGWNDAKAALGFRTFGIAIGNGHTVTRATTPGSVLDALCDNLRTVTDLADTHHAADLFHVI